MSSSTFYPCDVSRWDYSWKCQHRPARTRVRSLAAPLGRKSFDQVSLFFHEQLFVCQLQVSEFGLLQQGTRNAFSTHVVPHLSSCGISTSPFPRAATSSFPALPPLSCFPPPGCLVGISILIMPDKTLLPPCAHQCRQLLLLHGQLKFCRFEFVYDSRTQPTNVL